MGATDSAARKPAPGDLSDRVRRASSASSSVDTLAGLLEVRDDYQPLVLRRIGHQRRRETLPLLIPLLTAEDANLRAAAARAVMRADPKSAAPLIRPLLTDPKPSVVEEAAKALWAVATAADADALSVAAEHPDWSVRDEVADALGATGSRAALPALERLLSDPSWWVRVGARTALRGGAIPGADAVLGVAPRRSAWRRRRDVRAARRAEHLLEAPAPLVAPLTATLVAMVPPMALDAVLILGAPLVLGAASVIGTAIGLTLALIFAPVVYMPATDGWAIPGTYDRARCVGQALPPQARVIGATGLLLRRLRNPVWPITNLGSAVALVGLEVLLPAGGIVSGAFGGVCLAAGLVTLSSRRALAKADVRSYLQIDPAGKTARRVWLDSARR